MFEKRREVCEQVVATGAHAVALLAAFALAATPALAQQQNGCQAALQQVQQQRSQIILQHTNAEQTMATDQRNALLECQKQSIGGGAGASDALARCEKNVDDAYNASAIDLQIAFNDALNQEQIVENDVAAQNCRWTPEEISQFVATVGQAAAQLGQAAAQIISAAKGKAAGSANAGAGGAPGGSGSGAAPKPPPPTPKPKPTP